MSKALTHTTLTIAGLMLASCFGSTEMTPNRHLGLWRAMAKSTTSATTKPRAARGIDGVGLDREAAVALALRSNGKILVARASEQVASAGISEVKQLANPQLRMRNIELDTITSEPQLELALRMPIPNPWLLDARVQRAKLRRREAKAERLDIERRVGAVVRKLYARIAMLDQHIVQVNRTVEVLSKYEELAKRRLREGVITAVDASLPRLRHAEALDRRHELVRRRTRAVERLRALLGGGAGGVLIVRTTASDLGEVKERLEPEHFIRRALGARRDLVGAAARVGVARADAYLAKAKRWPWLRFAELSYAMHPESEERNFQLYLALEVPLFSLNKGAIAAREAKVGRREVEERALVQSTASDIRRAITTLEATGRQLEHARSSLLPALESGTTAVDQSIAQGVADPLRGTMVAWRNLRAQRRYLEARLAHREAAIDLAAASGGGAIESLRAKKTK